MSVLLFSSNNSGHDDRLFISISFWHLFCIYDHLYQVLHIAMNVFLFISSSTGTEECIFVYAKYDLVIGGCLFISSTFVLYVTYIFICLF